MNQESIIPKTTKKRRSREEQDHVNRRVRLRRAVKKAQAAGDPEAVPFAISELEAAKKPTSGELHPKVVAARERAAGNVRAWQEKSAVEERNAQGRANLFLAQKEQDQAAKLVGFEQNRRKAAGSKPAAVSKSEDERVAADEKVSRSLISACFVLDCGDP